MKGFVRFIFKAIDKLDAIAQSIFSVLVHAVCAVIVICTGTAVCISIGPVPSILYVSVALILWPIAYRSYLEDVDGSTKFEAFCVGGVVGGLWPVIAVLFIVCTLFFVIGYGLRRLREWSSN